MDSTVEKFSAELKELLSQLGEQKKAYENAMERDEVMYKIKDIHAKIIELEKSIASAIHKHRQNNNEIKLTVNKKKPDK